MTLLTGLTGHKGRLATELRKHIDFKDFKGDLTKPFYVEDFDLIIHCAAYTDVAKAETSEGTIECINSNIYGTMNIVKNYMNTPIVYISTEYAHKPLGTYAMTKRLSEEVIKTHPNYLIIRTLFKPNPWPFEFAYEDQYTQGDYIDVIAELIAKKINSWDRKTSELCYVGTGRKTMFELAKRTRPDVLPNKVTSEFIPKDYL